MSNTTTPPVRLLYSPAEAATLLGLSRSYVYDLMARGDLGSVKAGACRRIPHAELEAYVAGLPVAS